MGIHKKVLYIVQIIFLHNFSSIVVIAMAVWQDQGNDETP